MVLINDKKYACEKCIKGHRVTGCTHTDRALYEVKKKGRPTTQCQHCKEKRKVSGSSVHTKCACGDSKVFASASVDTQPAAVYEAPAPSAQNVADTTSTDEAELEFETRKGQPGSKATFPRGLKDVHELAAAAEALAGLGEDDGVIKVAERKVAALLNPCKCQTGGPCKCCHPRKSDNDLAGEGLRAQSGYVSPSDNQGGCCSTSAPSGITKTSSPALQAYLSPENMHHPAHTSPHVHKTKLYSPYSTNPNSQSRHGRNSLNKGSDRYSPNPKSLRPPPPRIRPLTDMGRLIGAALNTDGSLASEIPRSAVGLPKLPGISTFDSAAENGGVKVEPMEVADVDMPLAFPTSEDVVIGACMCGEECECPGCATHDQTGSQPAEHVHHGGCGEGCKSHHDCGHAIAVPSGITSIAQLISVAASYVPAPAGTPRPSGLDPHDTRILPSAARLSDDAARTMGIVQLKPLECCNGRCQCPAGQCTCEKECCGCCVRCACAEDDEDARMKDDKVPENQPTATVSCCSTKSAAPQNVSPTHLSVGTMGPSTRPIQPSPTLLSPDHAHTPSRSSSRHPSPVPGTSTPPSSLPNAPVTSAQVSLRRATSSSSGSGAHAHVAPAGHSVGGSVNRRATVTGNAPASLAASSKSAAKAAAPYSTSQHRAILPKPASQPSSTLLSVNTAVSSGTSRQPSPGAIRHSRNSSSSGGPTRNGSPTGFDRRASSGSVGGRGRSSSNVNIQSHQPDGQQPLSLSSYPNHISQPVPQLAGSPWPQQMQAQSLDSAPPIHLLSHQQLPTLQIPDSNTPLRAASPNDGFDPRLSATNTELTSFLEQWSTVNPGAAQLQYQPSTQPGPTPLQSAIDQWSWSQAGSYSVPNDSRAGPSSDTSPGLGQDFDIERFLAQALAEGQTQTSIQPAYPSSDLGPTDRGAQGPGIEVSFADYFMNAPASAAMPVINVPPDVDVNASGNGNDPFSGLAPPPLVRSDASRNPSQIDNPNLPHTPDDVSPAYPGAGMMPFPLGGNQVPTWSNDANSESQLTFVLQQMQAEQPRSRDPQGQKQDDRENIVDLSKPLDAAALSKIMRALQQHGGSPGEQGAGHGNGGVPFQHRHQQTQLSQQSTSAVSSQSQSQPTSQSYHPPAEVRTLATSQTNTRSRGAQHSQQPSFSSTNGDGLGGMLPNDLDDMFSQFVTLDGQGQGQNSSQTANDATIMQARAGGLNDTAGLGFSGNMDGWAMPGASKLGQGQAQQSTGGGWTQVGLDWTTDVEGDAGNNLWRQR
ncbi:hypothetical protein IAU60_006548 [Kwoniella sp. DSM 27419]